MIRGGKIWRMVATPPYRGLPWLLWLYVVACIFAQPYGSVFTGHLIGYDDQVRMVQVLDWINDPHGMIGGWYDRTIMRANPPDGFTTIWSRLVDLPIAFVVLVAQIFVPQKTAALVAATIVPLAEIAVLFQVAPYFARPLLGKRQARLIDTFLLFTSLIYVHFFSVSGFLVGEASHHPWYVILDLALFGAVARLSMGAWHLSPVLVMGLVTGLLTGVGIEGYPMIAASAAILALIAWGADRPGIAARGAWGLGYGAVSGLLLLPLHRPAMHLFDISFAEPSILGVMLVALAALFLAAEGRLLAVLRFRPASAIVLLALAGAMGAALLAAFPQMKDGATAGLSVAERAMALHEHFEAQPVYRLARSVTDEASLLMPMIMALGFALAAIYGSRGRRRLLHIAYLGFAVTGGGMSLQFSRYYHHAMTTACAWLAWAWAQVLRRWASPHPHRRLIALAAFVLLGPFWMLVLPTIQLKGSFWKQLIFFPAAIQMADDPCDSLPIAHFINAHYPPQTLLQVPSWVSQQFLYQTDTRLDFLANYPSQNKFVDNFTFFSAPGSERARQIAVRHGIQLVAVCILPSDYSRDLPPDQQSFLTRLQFGKPPGWLKRVDTGDTPTHYLLYQTDPNALGAAP